MTTSQTFTLICAQARDDELATAEQLLRLLRCYDLSRWRFTSTIRIEHGVIPHSHPVLTLNTRHPDDDGLLLSTYLHEQLHRFIDGEAASVTEAITALRQRYPQPPIGYPEGARDASSSYVHYIICYLEWRAAEELTGSEEARRIFSIWRGDHYRGIYAAIMDDTQAIGEIVTRWIKLP